MASRERQRHCLDDMITATVFDFEPREGGHAPRRLYRVSGHPRVIVETRGGRFLRFRCYQCALSHFRVPVASLPYCAPLPSPAAALLSQR